MNKELAIKRSNKPWNFIFFGNYFYGLCAVALSIEALLQQGLPLIAPGYLFLIFMATVLYYTFPYARKCSYVSTNPRTNWYTRNYDLVRVTQLTLSLGLPASFTFFLWNYWQEVLNMALTQWIMTLIFPIVAALYYGNNFLTRKYNLRKIGWLKPFVIGFIWSGLVTIYPVVIYSIVNNAGYRLSLIAILLFLKNLMFISVLCIMFDIKDYAADYISRVKTFVVGVGLRKTIFTILLPLSVLGLGSFIFYATAHQFQIMKTMMNVFPFLLLINVAWSLRKRKSLMYYLVVVDGLMLVKALCGTIAMIFFS